MIADHTGATEEYADVLAEMRLEMAEGPSGAHVDGGSCEYEVAVVWRCTMCGCEHRQTTDR